MAKTLDLVRRCFNWPGMKSDIQAMIAACPQCQRNKFQRGKPVGLLQPLRVPDTRWHTVTLDFVTCLPRTHRTRYDAILVFVDKLTKMTHLAPCKTTCTAAQTAHLLNQHVIKHHGVPQHLVSDRDPRFTSVFWKHLCKELGIKPCMSSAFHPQSDGQTERMNQVVEEVLRNYLDTDQKQWDVLLPYVEFAINNSVNASTGETPFFMNYGMHPRTPVMNQLKYHQKQALPVLQDVLQDLVSSLSRVKTLLHAAMDRQKRYADAKRRHVEYLPGQQVLLSTKHLSFKGSGPRKLYPRYVGPFQVLDMINQTAAKLKLPDGWRIHNVFHISLLRPYHQPIQPDRVPLPELDAQGLPMYQPERLVGYRLRKERSEYQVQWHGYSSEHNSWEPVSKIPTSLIYEYHQQHPA